MAANVVQFVCSSRRRARRVSRTVSFAMVVLAGSLCFAAKDTVIGAPGNSRSQTSAPRYSAAARLLVSVLSENGEPVSAAQIILTPAKGKAVRRGETDYSGKFTFNDLVPGEYQLQVQKGGFYVASEANIAVGVTRSVRVALHHIGRITQSIKVAYSPPMIDPTKTSSSASLNGREIIDLPYPVPRDLRYSLPLLPGVLQDASGRIHIDGSPTSHILDTLDGFDLTNPVNGDFDERIAPEALQSIGVMDSRYSVQYGRGSGGVLALNSSMGDDRYRFSGVNFLPTVGDLHGLYLNSWTPRLVFSGPFRKRKAWFLDGFNGEYDRSIVDGLPPGADENTLLRFNNLARAQVNLTPSNILTTGILFNHLASPHQNLSLTTPLESTINTAQGALVWMAQDQIFFHQETYLQLGFATTRIRGHTLPWGDQGYVMRTGSVTGNYFETAHDRAGRTEEFVNLYLPAKNWLGQQMLQFGSDDEEISDYQSLSRNPILIEGEQGQPLQRATFTGGRGFTLRDVEASSYAQDRWSILPRLLVESGARVDWDSRVHDALFSPRIAATFVPRESAETKLVAGIGLYNNASNLALLAQPLAGARLNYFYNLAGQASAPSSVVTSFDVQPRLEVPRVWNWSVGLDQKLPKAIYFRGEFIEKHEEEGWAYFNQAPSGAGQISGQYQLRDQAQTHYDAIEVNFRRAFKKRGDLVMLSYRHSMARSNAVLDFNLDNPIFASQAGGPLPWDAPNRLLSWGLVPLIKGFDLAYTFDWRTGFPFSVFNQNNQLVGSPDSRRMPDYFSADAALERRISLFGFRWDLRIGFDDLTGRHNPYAVNDNIDSPQFLTYSSLQRRTLQGEIRLLGRK